MQLNKFNKSTGLNKMSNRYAVNDINNI